MVQGYRLEPRSRAEAAVIYCLTRPELSQVAQKPSVAEWRRPHYSLPDPDRHFGQNTAATRDLSFVIRTA